MSDERDVPYDDDRVTVTLTMPRQQLQQFRSNIDAFKQNQYVIFTAPFGPADDATRRAARCASNAAYVVADCLVDSDFQWPDDDEGNPVIGQTDAFRAALVAEATKWEAGDTAFADGARCALKRVLALYDDQHAAAPDPVGPWDAATNPPLGVMRDRDGNVIAPEDRDVKSYRRAYERLIDQLNQAAAAPDVVRYVVLSANETDADVFDDFQAYLDTPEQAAQVRAFANKKVAFNPARIVRVAATITEVDGDDTKG